MKMRKFIKQYYLRQIIAYYLVFCLFFNVSVVMATPSGSDVIEGIADVTEGPITDVDVGTNKAIINWDSLDTFSTEELNFLRTNGGGAFTVLNRVVSGGATEFFGTLNAELGNIFIINTRGVIFGPQSFVNARNFVASGLGMTNVDFMNGTGVDGNPDDINMKFGYGTRIGALTEVPGYIADGIGDITLLNDDGNPDQAHIQAENIALIGKSVINKGIIASTTTGGNVILAAGDQVYIGENGGNVFVEVSFPDTTIHPPATHLVDNGGDLGTGPGTINADQGKVILAAGDVWSTALSGIESLRAESYTDVHLQGAVTASGDVDVHAGYDDGTAGIIYVNDDIEAGSINLKGGGRLAPPAL